MAGALRPRNSATVHAGNASRSRVHHAAPLGSTTPVAGKASAGARSVLPSAPRAMPSPSARYVEALIAMDAESEHLKSVEEERAAEGSDEVEGVSVGRDTR